ncbi:ABC transporter permease [Spirochaeta isovalerica]|uniref:Simple sugar transport system permease protein n=1 Tax=Spirochaeta isovalerica TaxID=150 RepID=A0A841RI28_9SPIO|nr:ABC transporter permease [Spirochaeta isovalerica]MBB6482188.1 simple sugar transport system permease protein [Spirochaeta isovalerica]
MRGRHRLFGRFAGTMITLIAVFLTAVLFLLVFSNDKGESLYYFFAGPFLTSLSIGNMLSSFTLLTFSGLAITVAFRADVFNLGGEGQIYIGALAATFFLLRFPAMGGEWGILMATGTAALAGGILAGLSGWLKARWNVDELISSFLLSGGIIHVIDYLITGPLSDRNSYLLTTGTVGEAFWLTRLMPPSNLNSSFFGALFAVAAMALFLYYTKQGYELRICGMNREFAYYGGLNTSLYIILPMFLSGAVMGLVGSSAVLGIHHSTIKGFYSGIGWNGIAVALIAGTNPLAVIPSAFVFAFLNQAASTAMMRADFPFELGGLIQAVVFLFISSKILAEKAESILSFIKEKKGAGK